MPAVKLLPIGNDAPFFLPTGVAASGYKMFTYAAGTSTKTNTYTDNTGNTANANPIILNSSGYPASAGNVIEIWGITGTVYKFVLAPSTDTDPPVAAIWSRDNIASINDQTQTFSEWISGPTPTFVSGTQFTLVGDQTSTWTIGRRVQATVTAGTVYGRITASAFTTLTTVTLQLDGTQALDSGISAVSYAMLGSLVKSEPERIGTSSGTDTYTATVGITRLVNGDEYKVKIASTSTSTTPTLNLDGTGAKTVIRIDGSALLAGDLNGQHTFRWDGTNQVVLNPTQVKSAAISGVQTANTLFAGPTSGAAASPTFRATVGADGASLVLLATGNASNSATIDFTTGFNSSLYEEYILEGSGVIPATDGDQAGIRLSIDGGSTFRSTASDYSWAQAGQFDNSTSAAYDSTAAAVTTSMYIGAPTGVASSASKEGANFTLKFKNFASTALHKVMLTQNAYQLTSGVFGSVAGGGNTTSATLRTSAVNGIRFLFVTGNTTSGTFRFYGVRKT